MKFPVILLAALLLAGQAGAATILHDTPFSGTWTITGAVHAPWEDPQRPIIGADESRLIGKSVTFAADRVRGPAPIGCRSAKYQVVEVPYAGLFEGGLATPPGRPEQPADLPRAEAAAHGLGFSGGAARTLVAGCTELQFHMVDESTVLFALNDRIYTMKRLAP